MLRDIVILNDYASLTGGSTAVALAEAAALAELGYRVTFFSSIGPVTPDLQRIPGVEVICLNQPPMATNPRRLRAAIDGFHNREAVRRFDALLQEKDRRTTVVHAHTWMKGLSPAVPELAARRGFRLCTTLHDYFISCPNGGFFDYAKQKICARRPLSASCLACNCDRRHIGHKWWRTARSWHQNNRLHLPERTSHFIAVSRFSLDVMRAHLPAHVPATVVRNPVDCIDTGATPVSRNKTFLYVGRLVPEKGVQLFAEAVRRTGLPAVFVGDGELRNELSRSCPQAEFTGWLRGDEIRGRLANARALVFPPLWYETLGLVALEAAAVGVPVICSDGCAATDFVKHNRNGLWFEHGSATALAARMRELAGDNLTTSRLGRTAYDDYWQSPWTIETHIRELLPVLAGAPAVTPATNLQPEVLK